MTVDSPPPISPLVRWLAVALVVCTVALLALGGLTTSRRAGMDDPTWPTEPWFLPTLVMTERVDVAPRVGYFLEHTHRFAGWIVGGLAAALAFAAWQGGPKRLDPELRRAEVFTRIAAAVLLILLLGAYGWFHGQMMAADRLRRETGSFTWPWASIVATVTTAAAAVALAVWQLRQPHPARWVRFTATLVLLGVMGQGLLGGLRVFLNSQIGLKDTIGVEFSQLHGIFAQVVFGGMVLLPMLAGRRRAAKEPGEPDRLRLKNLSVALVVAIFVQLIWAVWVRHNPNPLSQRLHILTAFVVAGLLVWLVVRVLSSPTARATLGFAAWHLLALLAVQLTLGVEAWLGKFYVTDPVEAVKPVMERKLSDAAVFIRTAHQLVGAGLLASATVVAFRVLRPASGEPGPPGPRVRAAVAEREPVMSL